MSKKDKKIEIQIVDSKVTVGKDTFDGFTLSIGKKTIGEIAVSYTHLTLPTTPYV